MKRLSDDEMREAWRHTKWQGTRIDLLGNGFFSVENMPIDKRHQKGWMISSKNLGESLECFYVWFEEMHERYGDES